MSGKRGRSAADAGSKTAFKCLNLATPQFELGLFGRVFVDVCSSA